MQNQTPTILPVATVIHADWQILHFRAENADEVKHSDTHRCVHGLRLPRHLVLDIA